MKLFKNTIKLIELDLSTHCDAKCPLCFRNKLNFPDKYKQQFFRNYNDIINQLEEFPNLETIQLCGQMSEPTLHPYILDLIRYIKAKNIQIILYTNGNSQSNQFYIQLANYLSCNDKIIFTICGATEYIHQYYRKNVKLNNVINHALAVKTIKPIDHIKCIAFQYNYLHIKSDDFKQFISQFSNYEIINTSYTDHSHYNNNYKCSDFDPINEINSLYCKVNVLAKVKSKIICDSYDMKSIHIDPYGNMFPCYLFLENNYNLDYNLDYSEILANNYSSCKYCQKLCLDKIDFSDIA